MAPVPMCDFTSPAADTVEEPETVMPPVSALLPERTTFEEFSTTSAPSPERSLAKSAAPLSDETPDRTTRVLPAAATADVPSAF